MLNTLKKLMVTRFFSYRGIKKNEKKTGFISLHTGYYTQFFAICKRYN